MASSDPGLVTATLDAGAENCATLILHVRDALMPLGSGALLAVVAYDPSAEIDLRSWCEMTGHRYIGKAEREDHSIYYLRRRHSDGTDPGLRQLRQG